MESDTTIEDELNKFLELTEADRTNDYLTILKETNALVKKLMNDVSELSEQLKEERCLRNAAEDKLLQYRETANSNISRYLFNSFIKASLERECTQLEWVKFTQDFRFSEDTKLIKEIYAWIDAHIK
jgi:uncharacterized coiled-coil DUF342 family protein